MALNWAGWVLSHVMNSHGSYPNMKIFMVLGGVRRERWIRGSSDHANFCGWRQWHDDHLLIYFEQRRSGAS